MALPARTPNNRTQYDPNNRTQYDQEKGHSERMKKIPVIVIADSYTRVKLTKRFDVRASITPLDAIARKGEVSPETEIAVVDLRGVDRAELVQCGIFLRNAGRTVIVCDTNRLPTELIVQLHNYSVDVKSKGQAVRTELLFIEEAIEAVTEVPGIEKLN